MQVRYTSVFHVSTLVSQRRGPRRVDAAVDPAQTPARDLRIAYGGIGIECSTYSRLRTRMGEFTILRDAELTSSDRFQFLKRYPVAFMPTLVATAVPGGPVERKTYETLKAEFLKRLEALLPLHGLYLPMHGAMFVEGIQDAEADWYHAARKVVGPDCLISASYDLHGNISQSIVDTLDMFSAFRTAPHIDREETMLRATGMLLDCLNREDPADPDLGADPCPDARRTQQHRMGAGKAAVGAIARAQSRARHSRCQPVCRLCLGR